MSFTTKMVWNGNWCGVDTRMTFSTRMLLSICICWLPWFLVANNIFQLSLLFSTRNYSWEKVGNVVGKRGFSTNVWANSTPQWYKTIPSIKMHSHNTNAHIFNYGKTSHLVVESKGPNFPTNLWNCNL
jgi:hypothetical protein